MQEESGRKRLLSREVSSMYEKGIYRHYKGKLYELVDVANHSETLEKMVVYRALYGEKELWVRPASMWNEKVNVDGKEVVRFEYIGKDEAAI